MLEIMYRRRFIKTAVATSAGKILFQDSLIFDVTARAKSSEKPTGGFETIGLYCALPTDPPPKDPQMYEFFKACGYNYLEFCEAGFRSRSDLLPDYYKEMSRAINLAQGKGFRVGIVLLAGMEYTKAIMVMGRPKLSKKKRKSVIVTFRVSKAELRTLEERAQRKGVPLARYVREQSLRKDGKER